MKNITVDEFLTLRKRITRELFASGQEIDPGTLTMRLLSFETKFEGGLAGMQNFIKFADKNASYFPHGILPTIVHDLNGMDEPMFSPRTSSY